MPGQYRLGESTVQHFFYLGCCLSSRTLSMISHSKTTTILNPRTWGVVQACSLKLASDHLIPGLIHRLQSLHLTAALDV